MRQEMMGFWDGSGISWTIYKQSAPRSRQITTPIPHHSIFYRPDALPDAQPTASNTHTHNRYAFGPGRPVPEETLTHSHPSWSSDILYHLRPFTTISGILFVHFTCLTVLSYNLSPGPLWSSSWSWTPNFILHTFLHSIIVFFSQHMPIPSKPVLLQHQCYVIHT